MNRNIHYLTIEARNINILIYSHPKYPAGRMFIARTFEISHCCPTKCIQLATIIEQKGWEVVIAVHSFGNVVPIMLSCLNENGKKHTVYQCHSNINKKTKFHSNTNSLGYKCILDIVEKPLNVQGRR